MTDFLIVEPEVAGGFGSQTIFSDDFQKNENKQGNTPNVIFLDYRFDGWMGDDIVNFLTAYAVTEVFVEHFYSCGLTGLNVEAMVSSLSDYWFQNSNHQAITLPKFLRLIPCGDVIIDSTCKLVYWSGHDICRGKVDDWTINSTLGLPPYFLVFSKRSDEFLKLISLSHADIHPLTSL